MDDEPRIDRELGDDPIRLLMGIDADLDALLELSEDDDGEEETDL